MTFTNLFNNTLGKVNQNQNVGKSAAVKLNNKMIANLSKPGTINADDSGEYDRILRILDIFKQAYRLYAKDVIPSGRPDGRISMSVYQEYEYIGTRDSVPEWKDGQNPGPGPWADKLVFNKWEDEVMKILEDPKLRKVLANTKFASKSEKDTDTKQQQSPGSGVTLLTFIEELLNGKGEFKDIRSKMMRKYFNVEPDDKSKDKSDDSRGISISNNSNPKSQSIKLKWETIRYTKGIFEPGCFYKLKYNWADGEGIGQSQGQSQGNNSFLVFWVGDIDNDNKMIVVGHRESDNKKIFNEVLGTNYDLSRLNVNQDGQVTLCGIKLQKKEVSSIVGKDLFMIKDKSWNVSTSFDFNISQNPTECGKRKISSIVEIKMLVNSINDAPIRNTTKTFGGFGAQDQTIINFRDKIS